MDSPGGGLTAASRSPRREVAKLGTEWWVNKVGTYGMASAQLYWGRMAALFMRILYSLFPELDWQFVFVDDFLWLLKAGFLSRDGDGNNAGPPLLGDPAQLEEDLDGRNQHMARLCH